MHYCSNLHLQHMIGAINLSLGHVSPDQRNHAPLHPECNLYQGTSKIYYLDQLTWNVILFLHMTWNFSLHHAHRIANDFLASHQTVNGSCVFQ